MPTFETFVEKPPVTHAQWFDGGRESAIDFIIWAQEYNYVASWIPEITYKRDEGMDERTIPEIIYVGRHGYIKGSSSDFVELHPKRWFVLSYNEPPMTMTDSAFKARYTPTKEN